MKTVCLIAAFCVSTMFGQTPSVRRPFIRAVGSASVSAKPDQVRIDLGVVTQAATAQEASTQNAAQVAAVLDKLRSAAGAGADIKTISYTLNPNYISPQGGGAPILQGYTATNIVEVSTDNLASAMIGNIIDAGIAAGANRVQSVQFLLKDNQPVQAEALRMAAARARSQVEAIASGLGVKPGAVLSAEEGSSYNIQPLGATANTGAATPILPGLIEVRATVTLELEIT